MPQLVEKNQSFRKTIAVNTAFQVIARAIGSITTFIITLVVARRFGAEGLGDFVKITTFLAFFYLIADFGLNAIYLQRDAKDDSAWDNLLLLRVVGSALLVLVAGAIIALLPYQGLQGYTAFVRVGIIVFAPSIVFQALITSANALFQKHLRYDLSTIALAVGSAMSIIMLIPVYLANTNSIGIIYAIIALLAGAAAAAGTGLLLARRFHTSTRHSISIPAIRNLFIASIPLGITLLFNLVYFRVDSIILTMTRTTAEVGVYGLVYKVFEVFLVFPTFFMNSLYPVMIRSGAEFPRLVRKAAMTLGVLSVFAGLGLWVGAPLVVFVRNDFAGGVTALRILATGIPLFFLSSLTMWILISKKKQMLLAKIYGISMLVNILLNVYFVPRFGFIAAAWITIASEALVLLMTGLYSLGHLVDTKEEAR